MIFASIDCGRAMMGLDLLANAARTGARIGALPGKTNNDVTTAINDQVTNSGFSGATTTIKVNGTVADVSTAESGDQITITVSLAYNSMSWLPANWFFSGSTLSRSIIMRKE